MKAPVPNLTLIALGLMVMTTVAHAKKVLYYSEKKGIMWVEQSEVDRVKLQDLGITPSKKKTPIKLTKTEKMRRDHKTYYNIGQRYFYDGDYTEALRYFENAYKLRKNPEYYLFVAKCNRKLGKTNRMLLVFKSILQLYRDSNVADDALFELALYYMTVNDYKSAADKFKALAEQYPYGASITNNQEFRDVAREQIVIMENQVDHLLRIANYKRGSISQRLRKLQQRKNLKVTGKPDQKTMQVLLGIQARIEKRKQLLSQRKRLIAKLRKWTLLGLGFLIINLFWTLRLGRTLTARKYNVESYERSLESLT